MKVAKSEDAMRSAGAMAYAEYVACVKEMSGRGDAEWMSPDPPAWESLTMGQRLAWESTVQAIRKSVTPVEAVDNESGRRSQAFQKGLRHA